MRWFSQTAKRFGRLASQAVARRGNPPAHRTLRQLHFRRQRIERLEDRTLLSIISPIAGDGGVPTAALTGDECYIEGTK